MKLLVVGQAREVLPDSFGLSFEAIIREHTLSVLGPWTFHSYDDGFRRLHSDGDLASYTAMPFLGMLEQHDEQAVWDRIIDQARLMSADVIFLHFFHHPRVGDPTAALRKLRGLPSRPVICTSLGDPFGRWSTRAPASFRAAAIESDVTFLTGMGYIADQIVHRGGRNLMLLPHGSCQLRFPNEPPAAEKPEFDVLFVGNRIRPRNPFGHYFKVARRRAKFVAMMNRRFGRRFAVVGKGWGGNTSWQGSCAYHEQQTIFHRSRVVVGGMPNGYHDYYMSDRPFIAVGAGVPFVDFHVRGVEHVLAPDKDWWLADTLKSYSTVVERVLDKPEAELAAAAASAANMVRLRHTTASRCRTIVTVMKNILAARRRGEPAGMPHLDFLSDAQQPLPLGIVANWVG